VQTGRASRLLRSAAATGSYSRRAVDRRPYATEALSSPLEPDVMIPYANTSANIKIARDRCAPSARRPGAVTVSRAPAS
jgi:hypothetical protein